ncbi:AIR synthase family protein [Peptoniphilus senegalensis]|uniref:AIR synthase family protein n=1 Tax=Peptoniphilus senegalensis TaxID=1465757 RepID=UPI001EE2C2C2|nr:AIR synthase family protein [Peptoniphilus senegalensis]
MLILEIGKLKTELLEKYIFNSLSSNRDEVVIRGGVGLDCAVLDFCGDLIVTSTDPITGATKNIGSLAINVSVNDVSCQCADPVGVLMTVLIPPSATIEELKEIIEDANATAKKLNVDIIGGHTEVTDAVNKILISTTVLGRANKASIPDLSTIKIGDVIAISKYVGIEGTSIISQEKDDISEVLNDEELEFAKALSENISVLKESKLASKYGVKYMHDITEGGLYGALWETGVAVGHGLRAYYENIPLLDVTNKISKFYEIDPMKLISSGSMLMIFDKDKFKDFKEETEKFGIKVTDIGEVIEGKDTEVIAYDQILILSEPSSDELYRVLV